MKYAVIGTNVLVSAMITHNAASPTVKVVEAIGQGELVPLYNEEIITEYNDVLSRAKFGFLHLSVARLIRTMMDNGIMMERVFSGRVSLMRRTPCSMRWLCRKKVHIWTRATRSIFPRHPLW